MGWEKVKLGDICEVYGGTTPSTAKDEYWNGDVVWLSPTDLPQIGEVVHVKNSAKKITSQAVKELKAVVGMPRSFGAAAYQRPEQGNTSMQAQACKE